MNDRADPKIDIGLAIFFVIVCSIVLLETRRLPAGTFEPLGSAPVPQGVAGLIIVLCLLVMVRAMQRMRRGIRPGGDDGVPLQPLDAVMVVVLTIAYVLLMQMRLASFAILTTAYLVVTIGFLTRFNPRSLGYALLVGLIVGYGCQYLFTRVFVVDLPGL